MKSAISALAVSTFALLVIGCANVPEASTTAAADCKVAPLQTASLGHSQKRPVNKLDQAKAEADFNRYMANNAHARPGQNLALEEIQRDCNR